MTGATSYLGARTIPMLQGAGHEVLALTRSETAVSILDRRRIEWCPWEAAPEADVLIHLATLYSGQTLPGQGPALVRSNVATPSTLVDRFIEGGGRRVVAAGSCWEECGTDGEPANLYAASKTAFRIVASSQCREAGRELVWLRFADIVGADDLRQRLFVAIERALEAGTPLPMTEGHQPFDPVWSDDAAKAVVASVDAAMDPGTSVIDVSIAGGEPGSLRAKIQRIFDLRSRSDLPIWGARPYRRGEPFMVAWRPKPSWWAPQWSYASIVQQLFGR